MYAWYTARVANSIMQMPHNALNGRLSDRTSRCTCVTLCWWMLLYMHCTMTTPYMLSSITVKLYSMFKSLHNGLGRVFQLRSIVQRSLIHCLWSENSHQNVFFELLPCGTTCTMVFLSVLPTVRWLLVSCCSLLMLLFAIYNIIWIMEFYRLM